MPIFLCQWVLNEVAIEAQNNFWDPDSQEDLDWNEVRQWLLIEESLFVGHIFSAILFTLIATCASSNPFWLKK